jgi:hypothetical protein
MSTHTVAIEKVKQYMLAFLKEQVAAGNAEEQVLQVWMSNENIENLDELLTKTKTKAKSVAKKKKKDPKAPKGKKSSFILFGLDERPKISPDDVDELMADQPNTKTKVAATGKILGLRWSEVDAVVKQHYTDLAAADKARYEKEMEVYVRPSEFDTDEGESSSDESKPKKSSRKKVKGGPKGAKNAFTFYKADVIPEIKEEGNITVYPEQVKEASIRWALLQKDDPDAAQVYKDMAAEDKIRHTDELNNYSPSEEESDGDKKAPKLRKKVTAIPVSAHTMETLKALSRVDLVGIAKEIGAKYTGTKSVISQAILSMTTDAVEVSTDNEHSDDDCEEDSTEGAPAEEMYTSDNLTKKSKSELTNIAKEYGIKLPKGNKADVVKAIMSKIDNSEDATKKRVNGLTAYCTNRRQELMADNDTYGKLSAKEITKKMTDEWRGMDTDARGAWEQVK